jgi:hypothetical protein
MSDDTTTKATDHDDGNEIPHWEKPAAQRWAEDVEDGGTLYATGIDCAGTVFGDEPGELPREDLAGHSQLTEGLGVLAALVGDFERRGGLEHLSLRSREFVEQLAGGLGVLLYEITDRCGELEEDLRNVSDEHTPGPVHPRRTARREHAQKLADRAKAGDDVDATAKEMWRADLEEQSLPYARGQMPCDCGGEGCEDCSVGRAVGPTGAAGVAGKHYPEEAHLTLGEVASRVAGDLEDAMARVSDLVAACRGAQERHAVGAPLLDTLAPDAAPLVDVLAALGPEVARAVVLADKIAEMQEPIERNDPRRVASIAKRALTVDRFDGLEHLYAAVSERGGVGRIAMTPNAFAAYSAVHDANVEAKLREHNGGTLPTVHLVDEGAK